MLLSTVTFFIISISLLNPANSSLISQSSDSGQGMMMGLNNSFQSLGRIAGPLWAGFVFDINVQLPYLTGMAVTLLTLVLSLFLLRQNAKVETVVKI
jgi:DHA1 family multidrug resistance protein-like MFS transporter